MLNSPMTLVSVIPADTFCPHFYSSVLCIADHILFPQVPSWLLKAKCFYPNSTSTRFFFLWSTLSFLGFSSSFLWVLYATYPQCCVLGLSPFFPAPPFSPLVSLSFLFFLPWQLNPLSSLEISCILTTSNLYIYDIYYVSQISLLKFRSLCPNAIQHSLWVLQRQGKLIIPNRNHHSPLLRSDHSSGVNQLRICYPHLLAVEAWECGTTFEILHFFNTNIHINHNVGGF